MLIIDGLKLNKIIFKFLTYIKMIDSEIPTFDENFSDECIETNNFQ